MPASSPCSSRSATIFFRAAKRSRPAYGPPCSLMCAVSSITLIEGRWCRSPSAKSLGSCAGVTFTAPGAELAAHPFVENDGNLAVQQRQAQLLPVQMRVALVLGMDRHRHVAQHGLGPRRGNGQKLAGVFAVIVMNRVANLPQVALVLVVDHFEVADRGLAARAPVHDVGAAIDQPLLVEPDEGLAHRHREPLVHGEVFAVPVHRGAQALHLVENGPAVMAAPLPYALHKGLAAQSSAASFPPRPAAAPPSSAWRFRRDRYPAATAPGRRSCDASGSGYPSPCG